MQLSILSAPFASTPATTLVTLSGSSSLCLSNNYGGQNHNRSLHSWTPPDAPRNTDLYHRPRLGIVGTSGMLLPGLLGIQLHRPSSGIVATLGVVKFVV